MKQTHDLIVVGGGSGGLTVASGCAQLGMKVALVEREHMGGDCLHFGCVPSKALLHASSTYYGARRSEVFAASAVTEPPADIQKVNDYIASVVQSIAHHDSPERFESLGADVILGPARFVSAHEVNVNGTVLSAPKIVISTGSRAAIPPIPGLEGTPYLTNRDVFSLPELPGTMIVLGGGPIGIELSQAFSHLGVQVHVVEMAPRILPRDDEDMARIIATRLEKTGIALHTGTVVTSVTHTGKAGFTVTVDHDGQSSELRGDSLLVAAGRRANTEDLNLEAAGLSVGRGGFIPVDRKLRTARKHIYAIGDVNGKFPFTHVAGAEAAVVVRRVALHAGGNMDYRTVPWVTYTDPELASAGHTEASAQAEGIPCSVIRQAFDSVDRAHAEDEADGLMKVILDRKDRVIGVQIAAPGAGELLAPGLHAVKNRAKFSSLRSGMTPYPTLSEIYPRAVSSVLAPRLFNDRVRRVLRTLFRYRGRGPLQPGGSNE